MLRWSAIWFVLSLMALFFGFFTLTGLAAEIAKFLFFVSVVVFLATFMAGLGQHAFED